MRGRTAAWWVLGWLAAAPAWGCSVCGCGDPLAAAGEAAPMGGSWLLRLDAEQLTMEAGSDEAPGVTETLTQRTVQPAAAWSPADGLTVLAQLPLVEKRLTAREADGAAGEGLTRAGLGDAQAGVRWFAWRSLDFKSRSRSGLALTLASTLPTGSRRARGEDGELLDPHAQLGTGGFGPMAGLTAARRGPTWGGSASVTAVGRTANADGYRYGSAMRWSVRGEFAPGDRWLLTLGADGRYADFDRADGEAVANTGGTILALAPAAWLRVGPSAWLTLSAQLPVAARLFGDQHVGPTVNAACQIQFHPQ